MNASEKKVFLETKLRNLRRVKNKMKEHADLTEETIMLNTEIKSIETELSSL